MPEPTSLTGVGVSPGVGAGPVVRVVDSVPEPQPGQAGGTPQEQYDLAVAALEDVAADLENRGQQAGGEAQHVLEAQAMMARDPELAAGIEARTTSGATAARATYEAFNAVRETLLTLGEYFAARVADLDDIRNRTVARLLGVPAPGIPVLTEPSILVAMDLAPADTALIDKSMVLAFATEEGGPTSHTSILARSIGIPAVVGLSRGPRAGARHPGARGRVERPGRGGPQRRDGRALTGADSRRRAALAVLGNAPGRTADGHEVPLLANIGGPDDVEKALANGAEGVGLFRSELLFLDRTDAPSEDEQYGLYRAVLEGFAGKKVVVRTLDAGADKPLPFLPFGEEPNPAMGVRGLRICMQAPEILLTQLRALARAAEGLDTELWVMAPMVADTYETRWFKEICKEGRARPPSPAGWWRSRPRRCAPTTSARWRSSSRSARTTSRSTPSRRIGRSARWHGCRTRGSRRSSTWSPSPRRAAGPTASPRGCAARLPPTRRWRASWSGSA